MPTGMKESITGEWEYFPPAMWRYVHVYTSKSLYSMSSFVFYLPLYVVIPDYSSNREAHSNKVSHHPGFRVWRGCSLVHLQCRSACRTVLQKGAIKMKHHTLQVPHNKTKVNVTSLSSLGIQLYIILLLKMIRQVEI